MPKETLKPFTVYLEDEQLEAIEKLAEELRKTYGPKWTKGAVIRLAISQFLTQRGQI